MLIINKSIRYCLVLCFQSLLCISIELLLIRLQRYVRSSVSQFHNTSLTTYFVTKSNAMEPIYFILWLFPRLILLHAEKSRQYHSFSSAVKQLTLRYNNFFTFPLQTLQFQQNAIGNGYNQNIRRIIRNFEYDYF